jgi:ketosteroid isomerase-like protein
MEATYRGHDGVRRFWHQWFDAWGRVEFAYERFFDAGDRVVVFLRMRAFGRASGIEAVVDDYAQVWALRDGRVVRMRFYADRDEAVVAAGITRSPAPPRSRPPGRP